MLLLLLLRLGLGSLLRGRGGPHRPAEGHSLQCLLLETLQIPLLDGLLVSRRTHRLGNHCADEANTTADDTAGRSLIGSPSAAAVPVVCVGGEGRH